MSSYTIEHENEQKKISVGSVNEPIDDIRFTKKKEFDYFTQEEVKNHNEEDNIGLDYFTNETKRVEEEDNVGEVEEDYADDEKSQSNNDVFMNQDYLSDEDEDDGAPTLSYDEIQQQKAYYLSQLKRLEKKGHSSSRRFGSEHKLEEIKGEVLKIRKEIEIDRGINYCRQGLMFCVSTIEMLNNKFDPFSVDLDGWSNVIMADKESYDDVFEELYEKYNSKIAMAPEIKLISMVAGSAMMFHLQKSLMSSPSNGNILGSLASAFGNMKPKPQEHKMKGPSVDTDELLNKLNNNDFSDVSSVMSEESHISISKNITIPQQKKRGRKPKNSKQ